MIHAEEFSLELVSRDSEGFTCIIIRWISQAQILVN